MFAMAGLGFVDMVDSEIDTYRANAVTDHIVAVPSAIHGMIHLSVYTRSHVFDSLTKLVRPNLFSQPLF